MLIVHKQIKNKMKTTIKLLAILLFAVATSGTAASAQVKDTIDAADFNSSKLPKPGTVVADRNFNKFVGTWVSGDTNNELTVQLEKKNISLGKDPIFFEMLIGGYKFTKNGKEVVNTLASKPIYGKSNKNDKSEITLGITDNQTYKETPFTAKLIDKNTLVLSPSTEKGEGIKRDPKLDFLNSIKLKKQ